MSDRFIANSVRYGIKDTVKDKFLELEEITDSTVKFIEKYKAKKKEFDIYGKF